MYGEEEFFFGVCSVCVLLLSTLYKLEFGMDRGVWMPALFSLSPRLPFRPLLSRDCRFLNSFRFRGFMNPFYTLILLLPSFFSKSVESVTPPGSSYVEREVYMASTVSLDWIVQDLARPVVGVMEGWRDIGSYDAMNMYTVM
jgi:hypothetical protein